ncbi:hypothetical protein [Elizabethkingia anophelis]|uniref:hypothetical protein n=1 Tax=Elizabethkingia anophelis TaxID=1117645 RepID=UPI00162ABB6A|nr:hypothetical protein [Elizabethkingia anophelis]
MKNRTLFRWLADALIITVVASLLIHLMGFKESVDEHIFNLITLSFTLLILIIVIIMALILLLPVVDDEDKSEQQPKEYCVITFYSIVNVNRDQYMHPENSIIISEEEDLLRIHSLGYEGESLPIYFNGPHCTLNILAIDIVKELANKKGVSTLYDCFTFNFQL